MSAMVPLDAIDPDAAYREWADRFLWHIDQLPALAETTGTMALAVRGVRASQLTERIAGGGFYDNVPLVGGPESRKARAVWDALRVYLVVASTRLGSGLRRRGCPPGCPATSSSPASGPSPRTRGSPTSSTRSHPGPT